MYTLPLIQKMDKCNIAYHEKYLIEQIQEEFGLMNTVEGQAIITRLRQSTMSIGQFMKNNVKFEKNRLNDGQLGPLNEQLQIAKQKHLQVNQEIDQLQQQLTQLMQKTIKSKLDDAFSQIEKIATQSDFNNARIDNQLLEDYLNNVFLQQLTENEKSKMDYNEKLDYVHQSYEIMKIRNQELKDRLQKLKDMRSQRKSRLM